MKKYFLLVLFIIAAFYCNAQYKIKKVEIEEVGFNANLNFIAESDELYYDDLKLKITPISTSSLNQKFLNESSFDGKFEYSDYEKSRKSYFSKRHKSKREKSDFEFLMEGIEWLRENDSISNEEYNEFEKQIFFSYDYEEGIKIFNSQNLNSCNPYYIGDKYLNTFKIEISNPTNTYKKLNKKFLIETGNVLLHPLSTQEITERLETSGLLNQNKIETLNRYNLPEEITIPPNSSFIKYFAIVPIDFNNTDLKISFDGLNSQFKWTIIKKHDSFNKIYTYFEFSNLWKIENFSRSFNENYWILKGSSTTYFTDRAVFIGEENLNEEFELISISLYSNNLYFSRTKYKGADYVDFDKNRRKKLSIKTSKLEELQKKVSQ